MHLDWPFQKGDCSKNSQEIEPEASGKRAFQNNGIKTQIKIMGLSPEKCRQVIKSLSGEKNMFAGT